MRKKLLIGLFCGVATTALAAPHSSAIRSVQIEGPNIVVRGAYLSKVEIWVVPTGTGITPEAYQLLGEASRNNTSGERQEWVFPIPSCETDTRVLATEVFAKGFKKNKIVGVKSLPYRGAGEIFDALCHKH